MALEAATGSFGTGTGAATTTVSVTGLSFQPKVVLFAWTGRATAGQGEGTHKFGMSYAVSTTDRGGFVTASNHSSPNSVASNQVFDNACIKITATDGTVEGAADFDAWLSDGFRIVIDDQFPSDVLTTYLALGGSDLTNVASATLTFSATGDTDVTSLGFQPDCALLFGARDGALNTADVTSDGSFGVAAGATPTNYVLAGFAEDSASTSNTNSYCRGGEALAACNPAAVITRGSITSWLSNGFRFNCTETAGVWNVRVLCLKGGQFKVGDILSQTTTDNTAETGVGFQPKALIFASHNKTESTADTPQDHDERTVGFATSATSRNCVGIMDKDNEGTMDVAHAIHTDQCYSNQSTAATIAVEGLMDLVSMDSDGFTFVMDDADPAQAFAWYLAVGNSAAANNPGAKRHSIRRTHFEKPKSQVGRRGIG